MTYINIISNLTEVHSLFFATFQICLFCPDITSFSFRWFTVFSHQFLTLSLGVLVPGALPSPSPAGVRMMCGSREEGQQGVEGDA